MQKKYASYSLVFALWAMTFCSALAQDVHYTQYQFLPLLQNAAHSGLFDANYRFSGIYRNQWVNVPVNYNSIGISADMIFLEHYKTGSKMGVGFNFYFDQAGDSRLQTLHLMIPVAYHIGIPLKNKSKLTLSLGFEGGVQYKALSTNELYFDSQYSAEAYRPNQNHNETFTNLNIINADMGFGFNLNFETQKKLKFGAGFALKHFNNIEESFIKSNIKPKLRQRFVVPFFTQIPINNKWAVQASYLFNYQNKSQEHLMGVLASYSFEYRAPFQKKINFGVYYRWNDAPSVVVQYEARQYKLGLSYDINASKFKKATKTYGGFELAASYLIKTINKPKFYIGRNCYTF